MQSERCPNKMLREFGGATLTDIIMGKLKNSKYPTFFSGYEEEFRRKASKHKIKYVQRTKKSAFIDEPIVEILSFLKEVKSEYLLAVNPCLPLLKLETIEKFLQECIANNYRPAFAITPEKNHYLDDDFTPVNFDLGMKTINTKTVKKIYSFAHALYFFNKDYFFENERYWDWGEVRLAELENKYELSDIDTEEDFTMVEALWISQKNKMVNI